MNMMVNLGWISHVMDISAAGGNIPAELHMSKETHEAMVETLKSMGHKPPVVRWQGDRRIEGPWRFRNIPLVINEKIPDQGILVRPLAAMNDPDWLDRFMEAMQKDKPGIIGRPQQAPDVPIINGEVKSGDAFKSLVDTPTDVLVGAATACDDVETVIVVMVKRGRREVEVRSNSDRFGVIGLLQAALSHVGQDG